MYCKKDYFNIVKTAKKFVEIGNIIYGTGLFILEKYLNNDIPNQNEFDEQEAKEMAEIRSIEQQAASRSSR